MKDLKNDLGIDSRRSYDILNGKLTLSHGTAPSTDITASLLVLRNTPLLVKSTLRKQQNYFFLGTTVNSFVEGQFT